MSRLMAVLGVGSLALFPVAARPGASTAARPMTSGTWTCTAAPHTACTISGDTGWDEYNNPWNDPAIPPNSYTLNADSHSDWDVVANQEACSSSSCPVEAYESAQYNYDNRAGSEEVSQIRSMSSSFTQAMPTGNLETNGFDAEAAYDIWLNDYGTEVMIWVDNQGQTPGGSEVGTASIGGNDYAVYLSGSTYSFVLNSNETSGRVNIKGVLDWLTSNSDISSSSYMTQFNFGWEICSTDGVTDTFTLSRLTLSESFS